MFKFYRFNFFLVGSVVRLFFLLVGGGLLIFNSSFLAVRNYFIFDSVSFYLVLLVVILGIYRYMSFCSFLGSDTMLFLLLRLIFSALCFCVKHSILFWCFYELSMIPLLYLIFKDSPYSERFLAGWYFACYLLVTSLPLILILLYLRVVNGSFLFSYWWSGRASVWLFVVLIFVFFTKIPLVPFHTWLPIVHAEATRIVSIFLRGYIMKLGLLGVYRCSYFIFDTGLLAYLFLCCFMSIFFFITAGKELDGKRWLAFLSLAHIVVPFLCLFVGDWQSLKFGFFYCLGHGLGAGIVFGLLWYLYDLSNRRNWLLLKSSVNSKGVLLVAVLRLLRLCSFPPTIQFFCEVNLVKASAGVWLYLFFWCLYLFLGGLVPLIMCGHVLVRSEWQENHSCGQFGFMKFLFLLCFWCYFGFLLI